MKTVRHISLATCVAAVCIAAVAGPEDFLLKVHGRGKAQGIGVHAREQAMALAQENALKALAGSIVGESSPELVGTLVRESRPFVHTANIVDHRVDHGVTLLNVEFLVDIVRVREAAVKHLLPQLAYKPRVLVLIADDLREEGAPAGTRIAATAMEEAMQFAGLEVADAQPVIDHVSGDALRAALSEDRGGVDLLGYDPMVDVAVLGTVTAERMKTDSPTNLQPNQAHLELRILRADDGTIVDSAAIDAIVHSVDFMEGATQAIKDAVGKLERYTVNAAALAIVGPAAADGFALTLEEPGTRENVDAIRKSIADLGAKHVEDVFYAPHAARLHFSYSGELHNVVKPLVERTYPAFRLENRQTYGRRAILRLHPSQS